MRINDRFVLLLCNSRRSCRPLEVAAADAGQGSYRVQHDLMTCRQLYQMCAFIKDLDIRML